MVSFRGARRALIRPKRPVAAAAASGIVFTATGTTAASPSFATSGTMTAIIGTASSDRIVNCALGWDTTGNQITLLTINGVTATLGAGNTGTSVGAGDGIWYANVTSGTSVPVVWNSSNGLGSLTLACGHIKGQSGGGSATPSGSGLFDTLQAQPIGPLSVTVPAGGVGVTTVASNGAVNPPVFTWTNATGVLAVNNGGGLQTQLGLAYATSSVNVSVSESANGMNFSNANLISVSWAP